MRPVTPEQEQEDTDAMNDIFGAQQVARAIIESEDE